MAREKDMKPTYEAPVIVPLGGVAAAAGAACSHVGSVAATGSCVQFGGAALENCLNNGMAADHQCNDGGVAADCTLGGNTTG